MRLLRGPGWAAAALVFGFLLLRPLYVSHLRERAARQDPAGWQAVPTNGRFMVLVPHAISIRYHDEVLYASCVLEVLRRGKPFNPFWTDGSLGGWVQNSVALYLLALPAWLCGGDMNRTWQLSLALVGAGWFLLFYRVFHWRSGKAEVALPLALFSVLFPDLYFWLLDVNFDLRTNLERYASVFFQHGGELRPHFYRLAFPFLSLFLLCLCFLGLWRLSCERARRPVLAVLLGAAFGLMAWVHPFEFAFGASTLTVLAAAAWLGVSPRESRANVTVAFASGAVVGLACLAVPALSLPAGAGREHLEFLGVVYSRRPYLISLIHLAFAAFGWRMRARESEPARRAAWLLLAAAQIGIFLCRNAHVVMGFHVQPFHYIPPGSFLGCAMLFFWLSGRLAAAPRWTPAVGRAAAAAVLIWALANEKASAESLFRLFGLPRATQEGLDWARENLPEGADLLSLSMPTNESIPLYTRARPAVSPVSFVTTAFSRDELLGRYARLLKTCRVDLDKFLAERWPAPSEIQRLRGEVVREQRATGVLALDKVERAEWFYAHHADFNDDRLVLGQRARFRELVANAEAWKPPFYFWVGAADAGLLRERPESYGGRSVYRNESVTIYRFE